MNLSKYDNAMLHAATDEQARLQSILNGMDALIAVCDPEYRILILNDKIKEALGVEGDGVGQLCYTFLQGLDAPCPACPHAKLLENPDKVFIWEHLESRKGSLLHKIGKMIDWPDGRKVHLEYALDITELRNAQTALEQRERMLHALNWAAIVLLSQSEGGFEETITEGCRIVSSMARLDRLAVWKTFYKPDGLHASQIYRWDWKTNGSTKPTEALADVVASQLVPRWAALLEADQVINGPVRLLPEAAMLQSFGCVSVFVNPVFINNVFWGVVFCEDRSRERVFTADEANVLRSASVMLATVVMRHEEALRMHENITQVEQLARRQGEMEKNISRLEIEAGKIFYDSLTGIYNRRFLEENMERLIRSLSRSDGVLSVMMVDIDCFKQYNDTYGHISGDNCLKIVAETLRHCLDRQDDFVARYGGEEFAVVLPSTDVIGAHLIAGKMLDAIRNRAIPHTTSSVAECVTGPISVVPGPFYVRPSRYVECVTVSIGVVTGKVAYTHNKDDFLKRADEMLYESKQHGRNQYSLTIL